MSVSNGGWDTLVTLELEVHWLDFLEVGEGTFVNSMSLYARSNSFLSLVVC